MFVDKAHAYKSIAPLCDAFIPQSGIVTSVPRPGIC